MLKQLLAVTRRLFLASFLLLSLSAPLALAASSSAPPKLPTEVSDLLDLNSATYEQLKDLAGIGDAYSKAIIKNRPYARKDELVQRKIIPQATYEKIKNQVVARQK